MKQADYEKCARRISLYEQLIFDKMANGRVGERRYVKLDGKLNEWEAELKRKKPRQRAAK